LSLKEKTGQDRNGEVKGYEIVTSEKTANREGYLDIARM